MFLNSVISLQLTCFFFFIKTFNLFLYNKLQYSAKKIIFLGCVSVLHLICIEIAYKEFELGSLIVTVKEQRLSCDKLNFDLEKCSGEM